MKIIDLGLADDIAEIITSYAGARGLSSEEMIRFVLGNWAAQFRPPPMPSIIVQAPQSMGTTPGALGEKEAHDIIIAARVSRYLLKKQIKAGEFKCENCMMALDEESFIKGVCVTCGKPLLEDIDEPGKNPGS